MRHHRMRVTLVAAALLAAPAAHAYTMNSLSSPGSSSNYVEPRDRFEELNKLKIPETQSGSGLQFYVGPSTTPTWGAGRFNSAPGGVVGTPPDQSKFNDR
jgi:hypothetical protein